MRRPSKLAVLQALALACAGCAAFDTSDINTAPTPGDAGDGDDDSDEGDGDWADAGVGDGDVGDGDLGDGDVGDGDADSGDGDTGDGDSGDGDSGDGDSQPLDASAPTLDSGVDLVDGGPALTDGGLPGGDGGTCDPGSTALSACIASHCCSERMACETGWAGCSADEACMAQCVESGASGNVAMCTPSCNLENALSVELAHCIDMHCSRDML